MFGPLGSSRVAVCAVIAVIVSVIAASCVAVPVEAQTDNGRIVDPYLGTSVILVGSEAGTGRDIEPLPAVPVGGNTPAGAGSAGCVYVPGPVGPNGAMRYVAFRTTTTPAGSTRETLVFSDPACTVPFPAAP